MRERNQGFDAFALELSAKHADHFRNRPLEPDAERRMQALAAKSLDDQARIERDEIGSFDAFVGAYRAYTLNRISV
jgi:glutamate--cysteine ligase